MYSEMAKMHDLTSTYLNIIPSFFVIENETHIVRL